MAFSPSLWTLQQQRTVSVVLHIATSLSFITSSTGKPFKSIFSFGDSLADTGNFYFSTQPPWLHHCLRHPYGKTYFGHPTGRCSDGRLIIDFIAESMGIPLLKPYLGIKNNNEKLKNYWNTEEEGVNFAVVGATALDVKFFEEKGIRNCVTNDSLTIQLAWFKELLPSLCNSSSSCEEVIGKSIFLVGEIGGNDFNYPFGLKRSLEEIKTYVGPVINAISSTIIELLNVGAETLMVPGNLPIGCNALYLTLYQSKHKKDYDEGGCIMWLNKFAKYYNHKLQSELNRIQELHPHANIIYADYYNAALPLYHSPIKFGFSGLKACCGRGGEYNYNPSKTCGDEGVEACDDPSKYISWDGVHLTEAAYRFIAKALLNGPLSTPKIHAFHFNNHITTGTASHMHESA